MRKPSLSLETFVTALAVLGAATGCSKAEKASAAPESAVAPAAPPAATPAQTAATPTPALQTGAQDPAATAPAAASAAVVAKPAEPARKKDAAGRAAAPSDKPVNASCGAGGCTPDMKKGNGN